MTTSICGYLYKFKIQNETRREKNFSAQHIFEYVSLKIYRATPYRDGVWIYRGILAKDEHFTQPTPPEPIFIALDINFGDNPPSA